MLQAQGIIRAEHAACTEQEVVLTSHGDSGSKLHAYSIDPEGITSTADWQINGEVTYIHLASGITEHETIVVVGVLIDGHPWISVFELNGRLLVSEPITPEEGIVDKSSANKNMADHDIQLRPRNTHLPKIMRCLKL